jgi:hypothetical protein
MHHSAYAVTLFDLSMKNNILIGIVIYKTDTFLRPMKIYQYYFSALLVFKF